MEFGLVELLHHFQQHWQLQHMKTWLQVKGGIVADNMKLHLRDGLALIRGCENKERAELLTRLFHTASQTFTMSKAVAR